MAILNNYGLKHGFFNFSPPTYRNTGFFNRFEGFPTILIKLFIKFRNKGQNL